MGIVNNTNNAYIVMVVNAYAKITLWVPGPRKLIKRNTKHMNNFHMRISQNMIHHHVQIHKEIHITCTLVYTVYIYICTYIYVCIKDSMHDMVP